MFELADTVGFVLNGFIDAYGDCGEDKAVCYGAAVNAVTAAYATVGYWMQADLLQYLRFTNLGAWAPLVYIFAAFGGLFSMAMGQPPRAWMWFFVGPAVYWWLIASEVEVDAVSWRVGNVQMNQKTVWERAETGLANSPLFNRFGGAVGVYKDKKPDRTVVVAMPFIWYDALISSTVQALITWTGIHTQNNSAKTGASDESSNLALDAETDNKAWFVLSTLKWQYLQDITAARLANVDARDLTARFFTNGCGDRLARAIDPTLFLSASNSKGAGLPDTVFKEGGIGSGYRQLKIQLAEEWVPLPRSMRNIFSDVQETSFREAINFGGNIERLLNLDRIRCDTYLDILVYYFRWESGGIYEQAFTNTTPQGMVRGDIAYNLLYGWDVKMGRNDDGSGGTKLSTVQQEYFIKDLILLHLFRNELALIPKPITAGSTESELTAIRAESVTRTTGSVAKYGEVYTWATMIPHVQGIVLMLLTMAYPFVAIIVLIPGFHGFLFTWMRYFAWAKIWDLGFALVTAIERSVWSNLSTGTDAQRINDRIAKMQDLGYVLFPENGCTDPNQNPETISCYAPKLEVYNAGALADVAGGAGQTGYDTNLAIFDLALTVGSNLDLDLANGYYIYLMAALYFAVPAVTAQVLMVQASSFVDQATGEASQKAGQGASQGYSGTLTQRILSNQATSKQASRAKAFRNSGLAHQAMGYENRASELSMDASGHDQISQGLGRFSEVSQLGRNISDSQRKLAFTAANAVLGSKRDPKGGAETLGTGGTGTQNSGTKNTGSQTDQQADLTPNGTPTNSSPNTSYGAKEQMNEQGAAAGKTIMGAIGVANDKMGQVGNQFKSVFTSDMLGLMEQAGNTNSLTRAATFEMGNKAQAGAHGIASFDAQQSGSMYRSHADRLSAAAEFEADSQTYDMMNQFAEQLTSDAVVAGSANIGQLNPNDRPGEKMGMAMSGMLNTNQHNTRRAANYFNPTRGGFGQKLGQKTRSLQKNFGYGKTMGTFRISNAGFEMYDSWRALGAETKRMTYDGRQSGLQVNK